jgi:hypothetical protein
MPLLAEFIGLLIGSHSQPSGFASPVTFSATTISPFGQSRANVSVRASLSRFVANNNPPGGATIGISSFVAVDGAGNLRFVSNGASSAWPAFADLRSIRSFTVSLEFIRCDVRGNWSTQLWG